ncbi:MAG: hypothetical protein AAB293_06905 [Pseudomonadota bacterium]
MMTLYGIEWSRAKYVHKGVSSFNACLVLYEQRELIRKLHADVVFLRGNNELATVGRVTRK